MEITIFHSLWSSCIVSLGSGNNSQKTDDYGSWWRIRRKSWSTVRELCDCPQITCCILQARNCFCQGFWKCHRFVRFAKQLWAEAGVLDCTGVGLFGGSLPHITVKQGEKSREPRDVWRDLQHRGEYMVFPSLKISYLLWVVCIISEPIPSPNPDGAELGSLHCQLSFMRQPPELAKYRPSFQLTNTCHKTTEAMR